ncbi:MAG: hypothetical protein BM556_16540 [Bacteriovorax sp. MedPE-SWde]|nr:MAG: hypothetical protein BM556_16540 [Bacteriovorax sp. MedPE-SWde]
MSLSVKYYVASSASEAFELAKAQITPEYVAKFNVPANITYPGNHTINAKGKGFDLSLFFEETECRVEIKLSFLLKPVKGKVLDTIENKLKKTV